MDKQKLIEYLERVVDLEKQRYIQETTLNSLNDRFNSLGIRKQYTRAVSNVRPRRIDTFSWSGWLGLIIAAPIFFSAFSNCSTPGAFFGRIVISIIVAFVGFVVPQVIGEAIAKSNAKAQQESEQQEFDRQYENAVKADNARVASELSMRQKIDTEYRLLYAQYEKTKQTLKQFYDAGPIYSKYHFDFVAVASFLDYFKSGRCSTLGENRGGDGAYNTYENELLHRVIINKLDQIIVSLDQIKANQWTIYNAIQDGNRISAKLVESTNRLAAASEQTAINSGIAAQNSAIAAYNSQQAANELNQIKWLQLYSIRD